MNAYQDFCVLIPEHGSGLAALFEAYNKYILGDHLPGLPQEIQAAVAEIANANELFHPGVLVAKFHNSNEYTLETSDDPNWEVVIPLVQFWMKQNQIEKPMMIEYSHTADRIAPGVHGGGVVWIWQDDRFSIDTRELIDHPNLEQLRKALKSA